MREGAGPTDRIGAVEGVAHALVPRILLGVVPLSNANEGALALAGLPHDAQKAHLPVLDHLVEEANAWLDRRQPLPG